MASQKSTAVVALAARQPKRQRGRLRVAALLDAAAAVFAEKGFDGATMTEIAARAATAIGSLYQFFPSKEALADALLARYGARLREGLQGIEARAPGLAPAALADALVDLVLELRADRASAVTLIDARDAAGTGRSALRAEMRRRIAASLLAAQPTLAADRAAAMARMLQQFLKIVPALAGERAGKELIAEARRMMRLYIADATKRTRG